MQSLLICLLAELSAQCQTEKFAKNIWFLQNKDFEKKVWSDNFGLKFLTLSNKDSHYFEWILTNEVVKNEDGPRPC